VKTEHIYGEWQQLQTHLLWCYDHVKPAATTSTDWLQSVGCSSAWLIRKGWAEVKCDGHLYRAGPGEWLLAPARARQQRFSYPVHLLSVAFQAQWLDGRPWFDQGLPVVLSNQAGRPLEQAGRRLARVVQKIVPEVDGDIQSAWLNQDEFLRLLRGLPNWLAAYASVLNQAGIHASAPHALDTRIAAAQHHLKSWPLHEPLDVDRLARNHGLGRRQLERLFLTHFGVTPHSYLEQLRLQAARSALRQPELQIKNIALQLGFGDVSHFSHWFHRRAGCSPRAFRSKKLY
jgi:AraC-like DNA-binding protein